MNAAQQRMAVSLSLEDLATYINDYLVAQAGGPIAFVLMVSADKTAQYVSNASRADGKKIIENLLTRWNAGRADIPAHYNPVRIGDAKAVHAFTETKYEHWHDQKDAMGRLADVTIHEAIASWELSKEPPHE